MFEPWFSILRQARRCGARGPAFPHPEGVERPGVSLPAATGFFLTHSRDLASCRRTTRSGPLHLLESGSTARVLTSAHSAPTASRDAFGPSRSGVLAPHAPRPPPAHRARPAVATRNPPCPRPTPAPVRSSGSTPTSSPRRPGCRRRSVARRRRDASGGTINTMPPSGAERMPPTNGCLRRSTRRGRLRPWSTAERTLGIQLAP